MDVTENSTRRMNLLKVTQLGSLEVEDLKI